MEQYKETFTKTVKDDAALKHVLASVRDIHNASNGWYVGVAKVTILPTKEIKIEIPLVKSSNVETYKEVFVKFAENKDRVDYVLSIIDQTYKGNDGWKVGSPVLDALPSGKTLMQIPLEKEKRNKLESNYRNK